MCGIRLHTATTVNSFSARWACSLSYGGSTRAGIAMATTARPRYESRRRRVVLRAKTHSGETVYGKRKGRTEGSRNKGSSVRGEAIVSGLVPKARTSFCLFTQDELAKPEYVGVKWQVGIKRIAKLWKKLDDTTKDAYKQKARDEWRRQRDAMAQHGFKAKCVAPPDVVGVTTPRTYPTCFGSYRVLQGQGLGHGSYGRVVLCSEGETGRRVAVKLFEDDHGEDAHHEMSMYQRIQTFGGHLCFLQLLAVNANPPTPWIALPFVPGTTLLAAVRQGHLSAEAKLCCVEQIAQALSWLHHMCCIAHMDLKPGNVLWDPSRMYAFLIDFGMSIVTKTDGTPLDKFEHAGVTALYRPPELWAGAIKTSTCCYAVDAWSFGCVMAEIFNGKPLMGLGQTTAHIRAAVIHWSTSWTRNQPTRHLALIPAHLRCLVWWCCAPEPGRRPQIRGEVRTVAISLPPCPMRR